MQNIENNVLPPLLNPHTNPPLFFLLLLLFFMLFQKIIAVENKYSVLGLPGNKFSGQARVENKYSVKSKSASTPPPPPQNQMVVPLSNLVVSR